MYKRQTEDIVMVGATDDAETTIALLHQNTQTDVLLLDIEMPHTGTLSRIGCGVVFFL